MKLTLFDLGAEAFERDGLDSIEAHHHQRHGERTREEILNILLGQDLVRSDVLLVMQMMMDASALGRRFVD